MTSTAPTVLRITLRGSVPGIAIDLVLPTEMPVAGLLSHDTLAELGIAPGGAGRIVTRTGQSLPLEASLAAAVADGSVLFVLPDGPGPGTWDPPTGAAQGRSAGNSPAALTGAAIALVGAVAVMLGLDRDPTPPAGRTGVALGVAVVLLAAAAAALWAPRGRSGDACRLLAPAAAAAAVAVLLLDVRRPGQLLLAVTASAVAATICAAVLLTRRTPASDGLWVWLAATGLVALVGGGGLAAGVSGRAVAALLAAGALCALPALPTLSIDVPDEALLDVDDTSGPAWRTPVPRGARGGTRVRKDAVAVHVSEGRRRLEAGVLAVSVISVVTLPAILQSGVSVVPRSGALVLAGCVTCALPLQSRASRGSADRAMLLTGGAAAGVQLAVALFVSGGLQTHVVLGAVTAILAAAALMSAVALGRGWRSVRWARFGDLLEGAATALALPAALVAAGAVSRVIGSVS